MTTAWDYSREIDDARSHATGTDAPDRADRDWEAKRMHEDRVAQRARVVLTDEERAVDLWEGRE